MTDGRGAAPERRSGQVHGLEKVAADRRHLIAAQVRTSTGFTWGRSEAGLARIVALGPRPAAPLAMVQHILSPTESVMARWLKAPCLHGR